MGAFPTPLETLMRGGARVPGERLFLCLARGQPELGRRAARTARYGIQHAVSEPPAASGSVLVRPKRTTGRSATLPTERSEERRVGKECERTGRSRWAP